MVFGKVVVFASNTHSKFQNSLKILKTHSNFWCRDVNKNITLQRCGIWTLALKQLEKFQSFKFFSWWLSLIPNRRWFEMYFSFNELLMRTKNVFFNHQKASCVSKYTCFLIKRRCVWSEGGWGFSKVVLERRPARAEGPLGIEERY